MHDHTTAISSPCRWMLLAAAFLCMGPLVAQSQDTLHVVPMYGVGDDEFLLSGYVATVPRRGSIDGLWSFARSLGISTIQPGPWSRQTDTLIDSPLRAAMNGRLIVRGVEPLQDAGIGRELQFYPFDSVQSPLYQWKFTRLAGGESAFNPEEGGAREQVYSGGPGAVVGAGIAYDWHPWQVRRFPARPYDTSAQDASAFLDWYLYRGQFNRAVPEFFVVARAHLFEGGSAAADDTVLRIEIVYEIPKGAAYTDIAGARRVAADDMEQPYATLAVRKGDLMPAPGEGWGRYHSISMRLNLARSRSSALPGPLAPGNESHRFDVRVVWTGAEKLALRSIALRDSIGELVLGTGPASNAYRDAIVAGARRALYGPGGTGPLRRSVIRLMSGIEPHPTEFATTVAVEALLHENLKSGFGGSETVPIHNEGGTSDRGLASFHRTAPGDAVFTEVLLAPALDTSVKYGSDLYKAYRDRFKIMVTQIPSLAEHNGGRFQIPLLAPTADAIEHDYEPVLQVLRTGEYYPGGAPWPWNLGNVTRLGDGAEISRATRRRMIATLFTTSELHLRVKAPGDPLDTLMSHPPEAAEIRMMANLSLAYGAHGIHYYWLGNYTSHLAQSPVNPLLWVGVNDSWGSNGPFTDDTTLNHAAAFDLTDSRPTPEFPQGTPRVTFRDFWVGYGVRTREIKRLNRWLAGIGPQITRLHWRDAYSMHATVPHPSLDARQVPVRPIRAGEIVSSITARSRTGRPDSAHLTYVELGLFTTIAGRTAAGARDSLRDVEHIYVVNRRAFERPEDVDATLPHGMLLDSLAESRTLTIRFALGGGDWRRGIIRVRELAPDTTRLPLASGPRMPLDTFVQADSAVVLELRPGGGALLEITWPFVHLLSQDSADTGRTSLLAVPNSWEAKVVRGEIQCGHDADQAMCRREARPVMRRARAYSSIITASSFFTGASIAQCSPCTCGLPPCA